MTAERAATPAGAEADLQGTVIGTQLVVNDLAALVVKLLGVPQADANEAALAAVVTTRRQRALEIIKQHDPQKEPDEWDLLGQYEPYGLDAMFDLGPVRSPEPDIPADPPQRPATPSVRLVFDDEKRETA